MTAQTVELIDHYGTDLTPVNAARVSMNKESDWEYDFDNPKDDSQGTFYERKLSTKDAKLIKYLADHKHTSCFEHQAATLRLKVPIFVARQIQRHRTFSYNEVSRRYVKDELEFYWPEVWRKAADNVKQGSSDEVAEFMIQEGIMSDGATMYTDMKWDIGSVIFWYKAMIENGVAPEQARMILPQNLMTTFYMSGNLRNWAHFLNLRLDSHAQKEIRDVAVMIEAILRPLWPVSMKALMT